MIEMQVQIPDDLFERAKKVAAEREWSLAEVVRRGLELMTQGTSPQRVPPGEWRLPEPVALGRPLLPESEWTELSRDDRTPE